MRANTVRICWNRQGGGNHVIQIEESTAGDGMTLLTNSLGSPDSQCRPYTQLGGYLQVLAEDPWTITVNSFQCEEVECSF